VIVAKTYESRVVILDQINVAIDIEHDVEQDRSDLVTATKLPQDPFGNNINDTNIINDENWIRNNNFPANNAMRLNYCRITRISFGILLQ
jgi:hypothetical protein